MRGFGTFAATTHDAEDIEFRRNTGQGRALDIILTGRKVEAEEASRIGLCERIAPKGQAREVAEALAHEIAGPARMRARRPPLGRAKARSAPAASRPARAGTAISGQYEPQ